MQCGASITHFATIRIPIYLTNFPYPRGRAVLERARRYELIRAFIDDNKDRNPKVPDIDRIVPLPPAKLPPWDGTFQWQKEQDAAVPPQKPSDKLIERLSKEKNLDPATGLPLTASASESS